MAKYGISHASVLESIWVVVEAVNSYDEFIIENIQHLRQPN